MNGQVLLERLILLREERSINLESLDSLNNALQSEVEKIQDTRKVITIDSSMNDFANNETVKKEMIKLVAKSLP